jgi:hypothetical protein
MRDVVSRQHKGDEADYDYGKVRVSWTKYHSIVYNNLFKQKLSQSDIQIQLRPTRRQGTGGSSKGKGVYGL